MNMVLRGLAYIARLASIAVVVLAGGYALYNTGYTNGFRDRAKIAHHAEAEGAKRGQQEAIRQFRRSIDEYVVGEPQSGDLIPPLCPTYETRQYAMPQLGFAPPEFCPVSEPPCERHREPGTLELTMECYDLATGRTRTMTAHVVRREVSFK